MTDLTNEQRAAITAMSPSAYGYIKELEAMVATATERIAKLEAMWPVTRDGVRMTDKCVKLFARFTDGQVRETTWNPCHEGPAHPKYWYSTREAAEASNMKGKQP